MSLSRSTIVDLIFGTLDLDRARGGHTPETLLAVFLSSGITYNPNDYFDDDAVRRILAELLQCGQLDMCSDGRLMIPEDKPDPTFELYNGSWYVTTIKGTIKGPFQSLTEAQSAFNQLSTER